MTSAGSAVTVRPGCAARTRSTAAGPGSAATSTSTSGCDMATSSISEPMWPRPMPPRRSGRFGVVFMTLPIPDFDRLFPGSLTGEPETPQAEGRRHQMAEGGEVLGTEPAVGLPQDDRHQVAVPPRGV